MAIQIFPREGSFGQTLGASIGGGLDALSQQYAQRKKFEQDLLRSLAPIAFKQQMAQRAKLQQAQQEAPFYEKYGIDPNASAVEKKTQLKRILDQQKQLQGKILTGQTRPDTIKETVFGGRKNLANDPVVQRLAKDLGLDLAPYGGVLRAPLEDQNAMVRESMTPEGQQMFNEPITNEQQEEQDLEQAQQGSFGETGVLGTLARALPLMGSGIAQTVGTGFGLGPLLNYLSPDLVKETTKQDYIQNKYDEWAKKAEETDPDTVAGKDARFYRDAFKSSLETAKRRGGTAAFPETTDIKQEYVKPAFKEIGIDITPKNFAEEVFETGGKALPHFISAVAGGPATAGTKLGSLLSKALGPAAAGKLTEKVTGSKLAGDSVTAFGYLLATMQPGAVKRAAQKGFQGMKKLITGANPNEAAAKIPDTVKKIEKLAVQAGRGLSKSPGNQRIIQVKEALDNAAAGPGKKNIKNVYQIYKNMGNEYKAWQKDGVGAEWGQIRDALKDAIGKWSKPKSPETFQAFERSNKLWNDLSNTNLLNENTKKAMDQGSGIGLSVMRSIFNMAGGPQLVRKVSGDVVKGMRHLNLFVSSPQALKEFTKAMAASVTDNPTKIAALLNQTGMRILEKEKKTKK